MYKKAFVLLPTEQFFWNEVKFIRKSYVTGVHSDIVHRCTVVFLRVPPETSDRPKTSFPAEVYVNHPHLFLLLFDIFD
jgi:hypothetical protein